MKYVVPFLCAFFTTVIAQGGNTRSCCDQSTPTCSDGSTRFPCSSGLPVCADGSTPQAECPDEGGEGSGGDESESGVT